MKVPTRSPVVLKVLSGTITWVNRSQHWGGRTSGLKAWTLGADGPESNPTVCTYRLSELRSIISLYHSFINCKMRIIKWYLSHRVVRISESIHVRLWEQGAGCTKNEMNTQSGYYDADGQVVPFGTALSSGRFSPLPVSRLVLLQRLHLSWRFLYEVYLMTVGYPVLKFMISFKCS